MDFHSLPNIETCLRTFLLTNTSNEIVSKTENYTVLEPVSYTHLDVYKRQIVHQCILLIIFV